MKKLIILAITIVLAGLPFVQTVADANTEKNTTKQTKKTTKNKTIKIEYETQDKFLISANLVYPKTKEKIYPLVVLLHSIGENSNQWANLPDKLLEKHRDFKCNRYFDGNNFYFHIISVRNNKTVLLRKT